MTPADLAHWQKHMSFTYDTAAEALGIGRSTYAGYLKDGNIPLVVALACGALAYSVAPYEAPDVS